MLIAIGTVRVSRGTWCNGIGDELRAKNSRQVKPENKDGKQMFCSITETKRNTSIDLKMLNLRVL